MTLLRYALQYCQKKKKVVMTVTTVSRANVENVVCALFLNKFIGGEK